MSTHPWWRNRFAFAIIAVGGIRCGVCTSTESAPILQGCTPMRRASATTHGRSRISGPTSTAITFRCSSWTSGTTKGRLRRIWWRRSRGSSRVAPPSCGCRACWRESPSPCRGRIAIGAKRFAILALVVDRLRRAAAVDLPAEPHDARGEHPHGALRDVRLLVHHRGQRRRGIGEVVDRRGVALAVGVYAYSIGRLLTATGRRGVRGELRASQAGQDPSVPLSDRRRVRRSGDLVVREPRRAARRGSSRVGLLRRPSIIVLRRGPFPGNYGSYFSPDFLVGHGDGNLRQTTGFGGVLLDATIPLMVIGAIRLASRWRDTVRAVRPARCGRRAHPRCV